MKYRLKPRCDSLIVSVIEKHGDGLIVSVVDPGQAKDLDKGQKFWMHAGAGSVIAGEYGGEKCMIVSRHVLLATVEEVKAI